MECFLKKWHIQPEEIIHNANIHVTDVMGLCFLFYIKRLWSDFIFPIRNKITFSIVS